MPRMKHTLGYYLEQNGTLTPDTDQMRDVASAEWYVKLVEFFDALIWQYYDDRVVFINNKFDPDDEQATVENLIQSFAIHLRSRARSYEKLYKTTILDYNPLWNVDGVEVTERELKQTGDETLKHTGTDSNTKSGNETDSKAGKEANTKTGNMTDAGSGSDDTLHQNTTFDSDTLYDTAKETMTAGTTHTTTYNSVKDEQTFTDRVDTHTYNAVKDQTDYNSQSKNSRNLQDTETITKTRSGNIGVTMSGQLLKDSRGEALEFDFFKTVVHECVNLVSYALY